MSSAATALELVFIGHILDEHIHFPTHSIPHVLGGPAACAAVIAARLGGRVGLVSTIASDFPPELLRPLAEASVDTAGLRVGGAASTRNLLIYDAAGDKRLEYLHKADPIDAAQVPAAYLDATILFACPMDYEVPVDTLRELRARGARLAIDLGGYGGATSAVHPPASARPAPLLRELVAEVEIAKASAEDCRHLFGPGTTPGDVTRAMLEWGARVAIVTLGGDGALVATPSGVEHVRALPSAVIDVTGAGDAFSAGFLLHYVRSGNVSAAVEMGCATAALVIEGTGGVDAARMPDAAQVRARIAQR